MSRKFNIELFGDDGVGATSLASRYCDGSAAMPNKSDRDVYSVTNDYIHDRGSVDAGSSNIMLMFDLSNLETYNSLNGHLKVIERYCNEGTIITLVGTKADLTPHSISREEVEEWLFDKQHSGIYRFAGYVETSSVTGVGVNDAFKMAFEAREKAEAEKSQVIDRAWAIKDSNRKILIEMLEKITKNPEPHNPTDKPDYFLAQALLTELCETKKSIGMIFKDINARRSKIITDQMIFQMPGYAQRDISKNAELSLIITKAESIAQDTAPLDSFENQQELKRNKEIFTGLKKMIEVQLQQSTQKNPWPLGWAGSNSRLVQGEKSYSVPKTIMDVYSIVLRHQNDRVDQGSLKQSKADLAKITKMLIEKTSSKNPMLEAVIAFFKKIIGVQRSQATIATYKSMLSKVEGSESTTGQSPKR